MRVLLLSVLLVGCGGSSPVQPVPSPDPPVADAAADAVKYTAADADVYLTDADADAGADVAATEVGAPVKGDSGPEAEAAIALDAAPDSWIDAGADGDAAADAGAECGVNLAAPSWCGCVAPPNDPACTMNGASCRWVPNSWAAPVCQNECGLVRCH